MLEALEVPGFETRRIPWLHLDTEETFQRQLEGCLVRSFMQGYTPDNGNNSLSDVESTFYGSVFLASLDSVSGLQNIRD